jgi:TetR/AcrR family transcriptional repressor of nem operon
MRLTKDQAAENRRKILEAAARLFREHGFAGVAVADLMKAAGFTHGGFYNHFPSKEAIAAEASSTVIARSNAALAETLGQKTSGRKAKAWRQYLDQYLSVEHRDAPASGCAVAALATDAARQSNQVQSGFAEGIEKVIEILTANLPKAKHHEGPAATRARAVRLWSEMVGALVLSRATADADPELSEEILAASRRSRDGG